MKNALNILKKTVSISVCLLASSLLWADALWIDVRTAAEYSQDHIAGDLNIPHDQIAEQISKYTQDKNTEIHLYCRSGNRAGIAKAQLTALGYTRVSNHGSIADARAERKLPACTTC